MSSPSSSVSVTVTVSLQGENLPNRCVESSMAELSRVGRIAKAANQCEAILRSIIHEFFIVYPDMLLSEWKTEETKSTLQLVIDLEKSLKKIPYNTNTLQNDDGINAVLEQTQNDRQLDRMIKTCAQTLHKEFSRERSYQKQNGYFFLISTPKLDMDEENRVKQMETDEEKEKFFRLKRLKNIIARSEAEGKLAKTFWRTLIKHFVDEHIRMSKLSLGKLQNKVFSIKQTDATEMKAKDSGSLSLNENANKISWYHRICDKILVFMGIQSSLELDDPQVDIRKWLQEEKKLSDIQLQTAWKHVDVIRGTRNNTLHFNTSVKITDEQVEAVEESLKWLLESKSSGSGLSEAVRGNMVSLRTKM